MSKTWNEYQKRDEETPQAAIDRLYKMEAKEDIKEALRAPQEARNGQ